MGPPVSIKGRGAADNPQGRFETLARSREPEAEVQSRPETVVTLHQARSIIARNDSPDPPFPPSIHPHPGHIQTQPNPDPVWLDANKTKISSIDSALDPTNPHPPEY